MRLGNILMILAAILLVVSKEILAGGVKTNINEVTDLFEKKIENQQQLEGFIGGSKNQANQGIEAKEGLKSLSASEQELEAKTSELKGINANSLESSGQQERAKEEHDYYETLEVDYNDPKISNHKKDIDKIADASERLMARLIDGLKEMNIDCKEVKGNKEMEPEYYLAIQQEHFKDTTYHQNICEELRNQYHCYDQLTLRCMDFADQPSKFEITGSSIAYQVTPHSEYTSYQFSNRGNIGGSIFSGGGTLKSGFGNAMLNAVGFGIKKGSSTTLSASETVVNFSFSLTIPIETVSRLEIADIHYRTIMAIKINETLIMITPGGGDRLELAGQFEETTKGKKKYGGKFGKRVENTTYYPVVNTGTTNHILGKCNSDNFLSKIDLRPYLKKGNNTVEIKVIGLDQALVNFTLNSFERICRNWQEDWEEVCNLK